MAKPTGGKNGRPKKPINTTLVTELHHEPHSGHSIEALFDLYIYFEKKDAPPSVLKAIQSQIEKADIDTFEIQNMVSTLTDSITTAKTLKEQHFILFGMEDDLQRMKASLNFKDKKWMMISETIKQINKLVECNSILSRDDIERIFYTVGKIDLSESSFILNFLDNYAMKLLRDKHFRIGSKTVYIHSWLLNETTLLGISYEVFEKVFRSATYNQYKSKGQKINFLKTSFYQLYLDLYKKECVDPTKQSA